jgi:anti-anti-sigma factor
MSTNVSGPADASGTLTIRLGHLRAGVPVVHVSGRLDQLTVSDLQHLLNDQLAAAPWAIVLDLSALSVLKPCAVPVLVYVACRAGEADIGLCVIAEGTVSRTLATAAPELFEIRPRPTRHCTPSADPRRTREYQASDQIEGSASGHTVGRSAQ